MDRGLSRTQWLVLATGVLATSAGIVGTRLATTAGGVRLFDNVQWTAAYLAALVVSWLGVARAEGDLKRARLRFALGVASLAVGQVLWDVQVAIGWNPFPGLPISSFWPWDHFSRAGSSSTSRRCRPVSGAAQRSTYSVSSSSR